MTRVKRGHWVKAVQRERLVRIAMTQRMQGSPLRLLGHVRFSMSADEAKAKLLEALRERGKLKE